MNTFPITWPSKPTGSSPVSAATQGYFRARNQHKVHALILEAFLNSEISQVQLARRCRKRPEVVSRMLGEPANLTLDTLSDLIFAICGGEPGYSIQYPMNAPLRNQDAPAWLSASQLEIDVRSNTGSKKTAQLELT